MLFKEIPFLRIVIPVCIGIITGLYFDPDKSFLIASSLVLISGFGLNIFFKKRDLNYFYGFPLTFALILCGLMLYSGEKNRLTHLEPVSAIYLCTLSEYPEEKGNSYRITARIYKRITEEESYPITGSIMLYIKKDTMIKALIPGDFLKIRCRPIPVKNRGNPYEFDYRFYMENHGIKYYSYASPDDIIDHFVPDRRKLRHRALIIRERIIAMYKERGITGERLALVAAITLGQKNMLDPEQKQIFINAGVMHIMAVSGLHAVILSLFIFRALFFMKGKFESLRIIIAVSLLWGFAFVTGLTPSVIRATLMFSFLQAGKLMKRNVSSLNSVLASAVILLTIHPSVLFDAGFLLSYSSVIFIVCFYRDLYLKLNLKTWIADKLWQSASVTLLAQAGTLPLTVSLFNRFPTWFILTNIIIVPLSSFLIIVGCLVPLTYPLEFISQQLASLLNYLTGLTEMLTARASDLPFSTIENIGMTSFESLLLFLVIIISVRYVADRKTLPVRFLLYPIIAYLAVGAFACIYDKTSCELIVYNSIGSDAFGIRRGKTLHLYSKTTDVPSEVIRHCATKGLKIVQGNFRNETFLIMAGEKKILIDSQLNIEYMKTTDPEYVILYGSDPKELNHNKLNWARKSLIVTSSTGSTYSSLNNNLKNFKIDTLHFVKESGAFRVRL